MKYIAGYVTGETNPRYTAEYTPWNEALMIALMRTLAEEWYTILTDYTGDDQVWDSISLLRQLFQRRTRPVGRSTAEKALRRRIEEALRKDMSEEAIKVLAALMDINERSQP